MVRPPFPTIIDASMIASFRSCPRKFAYEYLEHWKPKSPSVHLHAGGAFAKALEVSRLAYFLEGQDKATSEALGVGALLKAYGDFECPADSAKSAERMAGAFEFYMDQYPLDMEEAKPISLAGGKRGIEFSFAHPLPVDNPETCEPLIYVGRADMIVDFAGAKYIEDDKTTTSLGPRWGRQWDMRSQFTGYTWGVRLDGIDVAGVLVRGISILKTKYETQQCITNRPQWMIDRWYKQTLEDLHRMANMWLNGYFDYNLDHACEEYGGCPFKSPCLSPDPQPWLEGYFQRRRWDPVTRTETPL